VTSLKQEAGLDIDFLLMASQSVFDTLGQERIKDRAWEIINDEWNQQIFSPEEAITLHQVCGKVAEHLMRETIKERDDKGLEASTNISIVMISFQKLEDYYSQAREQQEMMLMLKEHQELLTQQQIIQH